MFKRGSESRLAPFLLHHRCFFYIPTLLFGQRCRASEVCPSQSHLGERCISATAIALTSSGASGFFSFATAHIDDSYRSSCLCGIIITIGVIFYRRFASVYIKRVIMSKKAKRYLSLVMMVAGLITLIGLALSNKFIGVKHGTW